MAFVLLLLNGLLVVLTTAALAYYFICLLSAADFFKGDEAEAAGYVPPISVLVPVRGIDHQAFENFESLCLQAYPEYEILFGVQDPGDPVTAVIEELRGRFPALPIRLIDCREIFGPNAKVSNLLTMLKHARYEHVLIVDSDIRVTPDYLRRIVAPLASPEVGLVTCVYRGVEAETLAAKLETVGISSDFIPGVLVARKLEGMRFALGATALTRKSVIDAIGGLGVSVDRLGDDFLLGYLVAERGFRVVLSRYVVEHAQPRDGIWQMLEHQLRWARSTRHSRPAGYIGLIFTHGIPSALGLLLLAGGSLPLVALALATIVMRFWVAVQVGIRGLHDRILAKHLWLVPCRDLLHFGVWCYSFVGHEVVWRGQRFRLAKGGQLVPMLPAVPSSPLAQPVGDIEAS